MHFGWLWPHLGCRLSSPSLCFLYSHKSKNRILILKYCKGADRIGSVTWTHGHQEHTLSYSSHWFVNSSGQYHFGYLVQHFLFFSFFLLASNQLAMGLDYLLKVQEGCSERWFAAIDGFCFKNKRQKVVSIETVHENKNVLYFSHTPVLVHWTFDDLCLALTCHPHFLQNDWDVLCAI